MPNFVREPAEEALICLPTRAKPLLFREVLRAVKLQGGGAYVGALTLFSFAPGMRLQTVVGGFLMYSIKKVALALTLCSSLVACTNGVDSDDISHLSPEEQARLFQERNIVESGLKSTKQLVLTFDDGPTPGVTDKLLDILARERVQATFFMVGQNVPGREHLLKRMRADGHILANHTMRHVALRGEISQNPKALIREVAQAHDLIAPYMNPGQNLYFRAPHGSWSVLNAGHLNSVARLRDYVGPVFWDIGGEMIPRVQKGVPYSVTPQTIQAAADWHCWSLKVSVETCLAGYLKEIEAKKGGVVLFHDKNINTVKMVEKLIPILKRRGYDFISLDDVWAYDKYR